MKLESSYALQLFFPNPSFLLIYYEAIANALDANASNIDINISIEGEIRKPKQLSVKITDDGEGFTDSRFEKFREIKKPTDLPEPTFLAHLL